MRNKKYLNLKGDKTIMFRIMKGACLEGIFITIVHVTLSVILIGTWSVMAADTELVKHQTEEDILKNSFGYQVSHTGQYPPKFIQISTNPLIDQPNLSVNKVKQRKNTIVGSKKAYAVTKLDYLKKEWCQTEPVKQEIKKSGCVTKSVINRFCYGQCNSFFIPRRKGTDMEQNAFKSCAFCRPKKTDFIRVTLNCPGRSIKRVRKKIEVIKTCRCMALNLD